MDKHPEVIWRLSQYATTYGEPGAEISHFEISRRLPKSEFQVIIFAADFNHWLRKRCRNYKGLYKREEIDGASFVWIRTFPYKSNNYKRMLNWFSYFANVLLISPFIRPKPGIVYASSPHLLVGAAGWLLAKIYGAKFVFEVRDLWPQSLVDLGGYLEKSSIIRALYRLEKFLYKKADRIVVLLPDAGRYISKLGIPEVKITWLPNGVSLDNFKRTAAPKTGKFTVMYAGSHGLANGLDTLIKAAKILQDRNISDVRFELVGDGPDKKHLMEASKSLGLENVIFSDPVPRDAIPGVLAEATAFFFSLKSAGVFKYGLSSNKLLDYLASGRPIIFACDSESNLVKEAGAGISIPPDNPAELADAVIKLLKMTDEQRAGMAQKALDFVKKYDYSVLAEKTRAVFLKLI